MQCSKQGYGGNRRRGTNVATTHYPVDLQDERNPSRVCYQQWGARQPFERGTLQDAPVHRRTRWFWFGDRKNNIELGVQIDILNELFGKRVSLELTDHDPTILVPIYAAKRRKRLHKLFYKKQLSECQPYLNYDVPAIAFKHMDVLWPNIEMNSTNIRRRSFNPSDLQLIEYGMRMIMVCSNAFGKGSKLVTDGMDLAPAGNTREARAPVSRASAARLSPVPVDVEDGSTTTPAKSTSYRRTISRGNSSNINSFPDSLRLENIRSVEDGAIMWDMVQELASLELAFDFVDKDWAWDTVEWQMKAKGVASPSTFALDEIADMSERDIVHAIRNISLAPVGSGGSDRTDGRILLIR